MTGARGQITAAITDAKARYEAAPAGSDAKAQALLDLKAAERTDRAARRAAGEPLVPEEMRDKPVTWGDFEELASLMRRTTADLKKRVVSLERTRKGARRDR